MNVNETRVVIAGDNILEEFKGSLLEKKLKKKNYSFHVTSHENIDEYCVNIKAHILIVEISKNIYVANMLERAKQAMPSLSIFLAVDPEDFEQVAEYGNIDHVDLLLRPLAEEEAQKEKMLDAAHAIRHLHCVDDEETFLGYYVTFFKKRGYTVTTSSNGHNALVDIRGMKEKPHVLIFDVEMPGRYNGIQLLEHIRKGDDYMKADNETLVIMSTGVRIKDVVESAARLKISGYCAKPVSLAGKLLPEVRLACFKRKLIQIDKTYCTGNLISPTAKDRDIPEMVERLKECLVKRKKSTATE
jgi:CheY-like chemotaxis protein